MKPRRNPKGRNTKPVFHEDVSFYKPSSQKKGIEPGPVTSYRIKPDPSKKEEWKVKKAKTKSSIIKQWHALKGKFNKEGEQ